MYHVSAQGIDERMINVHYCYYYTHTHRLGTEKTPGPHLGCRSAPVTIVGGKYCKNGEGLVSLHSALLLQ